MKKYLVIGSYVTSKSDNQRHYISTMTLVDLYHLKLTECVLAADSSSIDKALAWIGRDREKLIHVYPRWDGNYSLVDPKFMTLDTRVYSFIGDMPLEAKIVQDKQDGRPG